MNNDINKTSDFTCESYDAKVYLKYILVIISIKLGRRIKKKF